MLKFQFHLQDRARRGRSQQKDRATACSCLCSSKAVRTLPRQEQILTGAGNTSAFKLFIKLNQALNNGKT